MYDASLFDMLFAMRFFRPFRSASVVSVSAVALAATLLLGMPAATSPAVAQEADSTAEAPERGAQRAAEPLGQQDPNQGEGDSIPTVPPLPEGRNVLAEGDAGANATPLSLAEAVRVALDENYQLRRTRLTVENAQAQIRQAWSRVLPQVDLSGNYTRNVVTANPFAGGNLGGLFGGGNATEWVAFNERARQDDNPATTPITFREFQRRQAQGRREAGVEPDGGGNPFTVDNQFLGSLSITQPLFNGQAFVAIQGADQLEEVNVLAATREEQTLVDRTRETYYQALLAAEQARVTAQSAERTRETFQEVAKQVAAGTAPKFERVSARVELENLRAQLAERRSQAATAVDQLKRTIGFPVDEPVRLQGALNADNVGRFTQVSMQEAMATALENRPDVRQAQLAVELRENDRRQAEAQYLPTVSAFANFDYTGRVADDRTSVSNAPNDPFTFRQNSRGFFADELWNPSVSVGLRLSWNLFGGFRRAAQIEQAEVAVDQAEVDYRQLVSQVRLEVQRALRTLNAARERLRGQRTNVERAELNYEMAQKRLGVGVATQLQLREASDQLDQARLSYLQAVYDYLTAKSAYETAVGQPVLENSVLRFTRR
jgi:outer membrane protein TolC